MNKAHAATVRNESLIKFSLGKVAKSNKSRNDVSVLHMMMIPAVILLFVYHYIPMFGIVIAFQKFDITKGFFGSPWIGLEHFQRLALMPDSMRALWNTIYIAFFKMLTMFIVPIVASILLNEMRNAFVKRSVQTLIYLPHFLSWVILAGILKEVLSLDGLVNQVLEMAHIGPISFLGDKHILPSVLVTTNVWKDFGFNTIVYLASISGIDPSLYEAAIMDGANRWKQTWHVTLPGMRPIVVLCLVMSLGGILNAGFEQIFNLYSVPVYETTDIIDTFVYRLSFESGQFDVGAAVGLFKSVVSFIFVTTSYWLAYKVANYEIF